MSIKPFPAPNLQVSFALALAEFRPRYLQEALLATVSELDIAALDAQLAVHVKAGDLSRMASYGLRAELLFPAPAIFRANPRLIAYYRLLLGYSQKEFYSGTKGFGLGFLRNMEDKGILSSRADAEMDSLCSAFSEASSFLLDGLQPNAVSRELLDNLSILTVGPQFRGGANNIRGSQGIDQVMTIIKEIVSHATCEESPRAVAVQSASGRTVMIEIAADPDIVFRELMTSTHYRPALAIEVKGGTDHSNVHNRIGEAEKSHQKARAAGYTECWTVINVSHYDSQTAKRESPSTDRFYSLIELTTREGDVYDDFRRRILSVTGIASAVS